MAQKCPLDRVDQLDKSRPSLWLDLCRDQFLGVHTIGHYVMSGENMGLSSSLHNFGNFPPSCIVSKRPDSPPSQARGLPLTLQNRPPIKRATFVRHPIGMQECIFHGPKTRIRYHFLQKHRSCKASFSPIHDRMFFKLAPTDETFFGLVGAIRARSLARPDSSAAALRLEKAME